MGVLNKNYFRFFPTLVLSVGFLFGIFNYSYAISGQFDISASTGQISPSGYGYFQRLTGFVGEFDTIVVHVDMNVDASHKVHGILYKCVNGHTCYLNDITQWSSGGTFEAVSDVVPFSGSGGVALSFPSIIQSTSTSQTWALQIYDDTVNTDYMSIYGTASSSSQSCQKYSTYPTIISCPNVKAMYWAIIDANDTDLPYVTRFYPSNGQVYSTTTIVNFDINYFIPQGSGYDTFTVKLFHDSIYAIKQWSVATSTGGHWFQESAGSLDDGYYFYKTYFSDSSGVLETIVGDNVYFNVGAQYLPTFVDGTATTTSQDTYFNQVKNLCSGYFSGGGLGDTFGHGLCTAFGLLFVPSQLSVQHFVSLPSVIGNKAPFSLVADGVVLFTDLFTDSDTSTTTIWASTTISGIHGGNEFMFPVLPLSEAVAKIPLVSSIRDMLGKFVYIIGGVGSVLWVLRML